MNRKRFTKHYLKPSPVILDKQFTHKLPPIPGLKMCGEFIVQCELEETFSTNIISKYESSRSKIRFVEVYKNTENRARGTFVRLLGTFSLVKRGYPFLFLDAAISNFDLNTDKIADLTTRIAIHLPQATKKGRDIFYEQLNNQATSAQLEFELVNFEGLPPFWGPLWHFMKKGIHLGVIQRLRDYAWNAYCLLYTRTQEQVNFDYRPLQDFMIFKNSLREHQMFEKMGLSVPVEAQAAFFSILVAEV